MMASIKYTPVKNTDMDDAFDYSSIYTYDRNTQEHQNFKSIFTYERNYGFQLTELQRKQNKTPTQISSDRLARLFLLFGYFIMYIITFPVIIWFTLKKLPENERLVVFRLGHLQKSKGPGMVMVFPMIDKYQRVNISLRAFSVPPKQIITADKAIIEVGAEIYFQIVDAVKSVSNIQNLDLSTRILVQTALCNILVQKTLPEIEAEKIAIANTLMVTCRKTCKKWGVNITRAELSHIKVLQAPPPKKPAQMCMPPGLFDSGMAGGDFPLKLAQFAQTITENQGSNTTDVIVNLLHAMVGGLIPGEPSPQAAPDVDFTDLILQNKNEHTNQLQPKIDQETTGGVNGFESLPLDPENILLLIQAALSESLVQKVGETFQFEISGLGAGTYYLNLKYGQGSVGHGPDPSGDPAATLSLNFADLQAMLLGELKPFQAYMSGRLKVSGDTGAALKLDELGTRMKQLTYTNVNEG